MPQPVIPTPTCSMGLWFLPWILLFLLIVTTNGSDRAEPALRLRLDLDIGGSVEGKILDHTDALILVQFRGVPWALAFDELTVASAYRAKKQLLAELRGGADELTAQDHFDLGSYALSRRDRVLASREFRRAQRLDPALAGVIKEARRQGQPQARRQDIPDEAGPAPPIFDPPAPIENPAQAVEALDAEQRDQIIAAYKQFGQSVRQRINPDLELIETDHFLIWTDWSRRDREPLARWCEDMYTAVARQFGVSDDGAVFLGKCPVFCFRSKARFLRFAKTYDDWKPTSAVGYTRTDPSGYVHLVIYRRRSTPFEVQRLAGTLVHEGVHAFLHRYRRTQNISGWVGEGLANYLAQQVLGDGCLYSQQAELVARQYVLQRLPIEGLLQIETMPQAHLYPVAHSLVAFLIERNPTAFTAFIDRIKDGLTAEQALQQSYDGMDYAQLQTDWRAWVLASNP